MSTSSELLLERVRAATEDEYTIERELGRGGMAAVFLARDIALQRRVAIKVMLPDLVDVEGIADRFVIEARTSAHLDHPGIVTVYSVKQRAGLLFIVMKYIEGRTLEQVMKGEQALGHDMITEIVSHVAEALHFAHAEGVIHRDVKPSNIIIDTRGKPIVTDFGIAKITSGKSITVTGSMIGTPAYMSPEQCRGLPATAASDQYALGVMMYEMLARHLPFEGTIFELINAHCNESPPPLAERVPGLDPMLEETVTRMLAKNPRERWPALTDVAKRLSGTGAPRRASEVRTMIAQLARGDTTVITPTPRANPSGAATELATTPAPQLVVTPPDPAIEIGETIQLRVSESSGASLGGFKITWKSEDPTIATVDDTGIVTGRSVGFAKITASGGAAFGRVAVTVKAPSVDTLVVTPQSPELVADNEMQFVATVLDARGKTLSGQPIVWQSSDVAVCAVSSQGRAIGIAPGRATITAICGTIRGTAQVKVRLPGVERVVIEPGDVSIEAEETRRLTATAFGPGDRKLVDRPITWRSTVPTVVSVEADGTIKGLAPGTAAVIAVCDGKEGLVSVSVRVQPIVAVRIQPERLQLETGRSLQLKGVGEDRRGRSVTEKGIDWHSDDDQVALVDASGKVHAVREGRTLVHAVAGDVTSSIEVTVVSRPAAQIRIETHSPVLGIGAFVSLDATVLDADGAALSGREITWTSSDPSVIAVDAKGSCEAKRPGSVRITAACDRARATTKLSAGTPVIGAETVNVGEATPSAGAEVVEGKSRGRGAMIGVGVAVLLLAVGYVALKGKGTSSPSATTPAPSNPVAAPNVAQNPSANAPRTDTVSQKSPSGTKTSTVAKQPVTQKQTPVEQKQAPPVETKIDTKQPPAVQKQDPPPSAPPAQKTATQTRADSNTSGRASGSPPATLPPVNTPVNPPVSNPTRASDPAVDMRASFCNNTNAPVTLLTNTLGTDPTIAINRLFQARDAADTKAKQTLVDALKDGTRMRTFAKTVRSELGAETCDWVMTVDFDWLNFTRATRHRTAQMRVSFDIVAGEAQIKRISAITSQ